MNCPKCNNSNHRKDGFVNGKQRYYCAVCDFHYTVTSRKARPLSQKRLAVALHIMGLSNRKIKKILDVSDVAVLNWIKNYNQNPNQTNVRHSELCEMNSEEMRRFVETQKNVLLISIEAEKNVIFRLQCKTIET